MKCTTPLEIELGPAWEAFSFYPRAASPLDPQRLRARHIDAGSINRNKFNA
jgi:hypothetical protein